MNERVTIGVDLGTSAVKVLAVGLDGTHVAQGSAFYGLETPAPLAVEQDAEVVYRAAMRVLAGVIADVHLRGAEPIAIGFSSAMHGVVCVDAAGTPISRAITWMDRRSREVAAAWRADGTAERLYRVTGAPMHPMLPIAKIRWLHESAPELVARTARFVGIKELFVYRLTGEWLVDWGIAAATGLFDATTCAWNPDALQAAGIGADRLSAPRPPSTALTALHPAIAAELGVRRDIAIVLASSDGALATIGSGADAGDVSVTLGTSGAVRVLHDAPAFDARARTFCYRADDTRFIVGGPTSSAGASLDWILALLFAELPNEQRFAHAAELAAAVAPGADGVSVLPFLSGERAPYWDPELRGSFAGLELGHDRRALVRAAFEGVTFGVYAVYAVLRETVAPARRLLLSGGLTKASLVRTMLADLFGVPAAQPHEEEAAAFGAALLAAASVGVIDDAAATARACGAGDAVEPDARHADAYARAFERYRVLVDASRNVQPQVAATFRS